jgi:phosphoribosylformimino-5-aminoimidazole carboxamide ribotide isomerase
MKLFRIIPVIDILNSKAVHAKKGIRENYKPLRSKLFHSNNPSKIIKCLRYKYGFKEIYIADLDAIVKKKPNFKLLSKISKIPDIIILIDPGIATLDDVRVFSQYDFEKLILGLETLNNLEVISESIKLIGSHKIIISIDMYNEKVSTNIKELKNVSLIEIVKKIENLGVNEIILLDLFMVGQKLGGVPPLYLNIRNVFRKKILVGGGIKEYKDIVTYSKYNFSGVLIGTALHDGTIEIEKIRNF